MRCTSRAVDSGQRDLRRRTRRSRRRSGTGVRARRACCQRSRVVRHIRTPADSRWVCPSRQIARIDRDRRRAARSPGSSSFENASVVVRRAAVGTADAYCDGASRPSTGVCLSGWNGTRSVSHSRWSRGVSSRCSRIEMKSWRDGPQECSPTPIRRKRWRKRVRRSP